MSASAASTSRRPTGERRVVADTEAQPMRIAQLERRSREQLRNSARPTGSGVRHVGHLDVFHRLARPRGVDHSAIAGIETYVANGVVEEHQVTQLEIGLGYPTTYVVLLTG